MTNNARAQEPIAVLFLGEALLIPHLYPIVEALAETPGLALDLWVSTSMHEGLLTPWVEALGNPAVRLRRAPGFRRYPADRASFNPPLPAKLPMLARLLPRLLHAPVVLCAERTSLWLPALLPLRARFVDTSHGAGSMSARRGRRRRASALTLVPGERERQAYLELGFDPRRVVAIGYVKQAFRQRSNAAPAFAEPRPILLYTPHWQAHRSSWPAWGAQIVEMLAEQSRFNVILAPHQRLVERAPEVRAVLESVAALGHVHCDLDSFAMVDGSYTAAADLYLGDTSSQVLEFVMQPRPCIFLNPQRVAWREDPAYAQWAMGAVVESLDALPAALDAATADHPLYAETQAAFATESLGPLDGQAPRRAAAEILRLYREQT